MNESQMAGLLPAASRGLTSARQAAVPPLPLYETPGSGVSAAESVSMRIETPKPPMGTSGVRSPKMLTVKLSPSAALVGTVSRMAVAVPWLAALVCSGPDWPDWPKKRPITIAKTAMSGSDSTATILNVCTVFTFTRENLLYSRGA